MSRWKLFLIAGFLTCMAGTLSARSLTEFLFCGCDFSPCPTAPCRPFSGFFVGVNGGIATNMAETSIFSDVITLASNGESFSTDNNIYQLRPWGEVFGGWGWQFCWLYLGGRVGANFSKFDPDSHLDAQIVSLGATQFFDVHRDNIKTELRITEYTFDFKPGIVFCNNTMLFALFGAALNKQHMHGRAVYSFFAIPPGDAGTSTIEVSRRRSSAGFRGGAGIEHMFCGCLSLNLTYVYTRYWELSETESRNDFPDLNQGFTATFSTKAHKQVTSIGLTAYF